jgi:hypothetical protein
MLGFGTATRTAIATETFLREGFEKLFLFSKRGKKVSLRKYVGLDVGSDKDLCKTFGRVERRKNIKTINHTCIQHKDNLHCWSGEFETFFL